MITVAPDLSAGPVCEREHLHYQQLQHTPDNESMILHVRVWFPIEPNGNLHNIAFAVIVTVVLFCFPLEEGSLMLLPPVPFCT